MMENKTPKQVIVLRKDLNMRKGKMTAQGSHASMGVIFNYMTPNYRNPGELTRTFTITLPEGETGEFMYKWMTGIFKKVVVGVDTLEELMMVYEKAKSVGIPCSLIQDSGLTEFGGVPTYTAVAIGPDNPDKIDKITGNLNLL
jgi:PTH2 family peptidyl-tRNA hydrolase